MSLYSRLHAAKRYPSAQPPIQDWTGGRRGDDQDSTIEDERALARKAYESRPTRLERFRNDPKERGGTVVVHYIKHETWFLETALALLGQREPLEH